jgi:class 3 adenylate cyclase/tetratricopeptide (TPR) repeat protein
VPFTCPSCRSTNPDGARFCSSCGTPLSQQSRVAGKERKFATVLFADLVGSTSLAEREDPEVVQHLVAQTFRRLAQEIEGHGGFLERFIGDAVMAVFGTPVAHEDDPERAVRAALSMQGMVSELNQEFVAEGKPELAVRIGVEAGEVLVDLEELMTSRDRMLTGDAVNTAARLQSACRPGAVLVGPAAHAATDRVIDYEGLAPMILKGKAEPIPVWEATRIRPGLRGRDAAAVTSEMVGRDEEFSILAEALKTVRSERRPALVTVLGLPGVGKSRLAVEFRAHAESLGASWRSGSCPAYGGVSYSALVDVVKAECGILDDDPPTALERKVGETTRGLFGDGSAAPHLLTLVGSRGSGTFSREELFESWRRFLEQMSIHGALVLLLEDIHWADAGLLDFIEYLAGWGAAPVLVLTLARPELLDLRPGWGAQLSSYREVRLQPLTVDQNEEMLERLLTGTVPAQLKRLVVERSEGNPLFTEEFVRMLIDRGWIEQADGRGWRVVREVSEAEVPSSLHALIQARLDGLPMEERSILQDSSVIGRTFWSGAAARLSDRPAESVLDGLARLQRKETIRPHEPSAFSGELEFLFRHVLIRDVAYDTLPKSLRAPKHLAVAGWAEEQAGARSGEIAELIASHYASAVRYMAELKEPPNRRREAERKAHRWARAAGDRAWGLWQPTEAVRWYDGALALVDEAEVGKEELAELWEAYARSCFGTKGFEEVSRAFEQSLSLYDELGLDQAAGRVESELAQVAFRMGRDEVVLPWIDRALSRLEPLGESHDLAAALHTLGWYHWRRGHPEQAEPPLRRSMEMAAGIGDLVTQGQATQTLGILLCERGLWREGLSLVERSDVIAKAAGDLGLMTRVYNNLPTILIDYASDLERAEIILREGLELARKAGRADRVAWIVGTLGECMAVLGRLDEAEEYLHLAVESARRVSDAPYIGMSLEALGMVKLLKGNLEAAEQVHGEATRILQSNREPQSEALAAELGGSIARAKGEHDRFIEVSSAAIESLQAATYTQVGEGILIELVRELAAAGRGSEARKYGELLHAWAAGRIHWEAFASWADGVLAGRVEEGREAIRRAAETLGALGRRIWQARCLIDLADAERSLGLDPRPTLEQARDILADSGAVLYLQEAQAALASLPA